MGTRHLIAVFYKGEYRIAQYGQWDGYPSGQGVDVLKFLRKEMKLPLFHERLLALREITEAEIDKVNALGDGWQTEYPHLSRDAGSDILLMVQKGVRDNAVKLYIDFAGDSLYCEYAYVIDFDKGTFEIFKGFNTDPVDPSERFADAKRDNEKYYPVRFWKSYPLDALPTKAKFLKDLDDSEDESEEDTPEPLPDRETLIEEALDRLQDAARSADHLGQEIVGVKTGDLITALQQMDLKGMINLDLD